MAGRLKKKWGQSRRLGWVCGSLNCWTSTPGVLVSAGAAFGCVHIWPIVPARPEVTAVLPCLNTRPLPTSSAPGPPHKGCSLHQTQLWCQNQLLTLMGGCTLRVIVMCDQGSHILPVTPSLWEIVRKLQSRMVSCLQGTRDFFLLISYVVTL